MSRTSIKGEIVRSLIRKCSGSTEVGSSDSRRVEKTQKAKEAKKSTKDHKKKSNDWNSRESIIIQTRNLTGSYSRLT